MSYADAAASSGPIGADKIANPPQVKNVTEPSGNIEVVSEEEFTNLKNKTKETLDHLASSASEKLSHAKKDLDELEKESKNIINHAIDYINEELVWLDNRLGGFFTNFSKSASDTVSTVYVELQNPVVLVQSIIGLTGIAAGYVAYVDRYRIRSDNNLVLGIHASIITGLVLVDGYLFNKYYPQFQKK